MRSLIRTVFAPTLAIGIASTGLIVGASPASAAVSCSTYAQVFNTSGTTQANVPSTSTTGGFNCTLGSGTTGTGVRALQRTLNNCYSAGLTVDSNFGSATAAALKRAQRAAGVSDDGVYGPATRDAIDHIYYRVDGTRDGGAAFVCGTVYI